MNIESLIEDYKKQTKICAEVDYAERRSVKKNNKAVDRMYQIVALISENDSQNKIDSFAELLKEEKNKTNLWSAIHLLEKLNFNKQHEKDALKIIQKAAKGDGTEALGLQYWLKDYKLK